MSEIRFATYNNRSETKPYSTNKWGKTNDNIFNELGKLVNNDTKIKIADFLNLFYYFIICYSKTCFKKHANWNSQYKTKYRLAIGKVFNYEIANRNNSHKKLLEIQTKMHFYRIEFKNLSYPISKYFNEDKQTEILKFINNGLWEICNVIAEPVLLLSADIKQKLAKYKEDENPKKSTKINYAKLAEILQTSSH